MSDDELDFSQLVPDAKKLAIEPRVALGAAKPARETLQQRRQAAVHADALDRGLSTQYALPLSAIDELNYCRPGVQHGVFKKLRLGRYVAEASLDLHRRTVEQARRDVLQFIGEAERLGLRTLLINHGKATHGDGKVATIKSFVNQWLQQIDSVLAFHSAQRHHGGTGACYVLLKKGEQQKLHNSEHFAKRRHS